MRRFSQRNALVTLSEINITPLLDLAFVLLIIFIIISPSIRVTEEHGMDLKLPQGGAPVTRVDRRNIRAIEVGRDGTYALGGKPATLAQMEQQLVNEFRLNPQLVVDIRCDENGINKHTYAVLHMCQQNGLPIHLATDPASRK